MLSVEPQPEQLLLEAVEAPWRGVSGEESSDGEMVVASSLQPGGPPPKRMRGVTSGQGGRGKQQQKRGGTGAGDREGLEGRGKTVASGACRGSVQILVAQCWLLAGT